MTTIEGRDDDFEIAGERIPPGSARDLALPLTQSYSGSDVTIPLHVMRGRRPGPVVLLTAAVHGDELNGTGIVRELLLSPPDLRAGTLVLVPVVNILGYERHTRYLPDRRDLNRGFPGSLEGSLTSRIAHTVFHGLVLRCDYLVDFHTAAVRRTNFPNVRADLSLPETERLALAFGCEIVLDHPGARGSLRRAAGQAGRAAITLEAGEVWKIEPAVVEVGLRGVHNVLATLGMVDGQPHRPAYQVRSDRSTWLRSESGGLLRFHAAPGEMVDKGQPIATCRTLLGAERSTLSAPKAGVIIGLTTLPSVKPGDPVCHIAFPRGGLLPIRQAVHDLSEESLHERVREDLAANVAVDEKR